MRISRFLSLLTVGLATAELFEGSAEYSDWFQTHGSKYSRSHHLPHEEGGLSLLWSLKEDSIHLVVIARAQGWLGVGFSENGGMLGADMMIYEQGNVLDMYVTDDFVPQLDDCQSWTLVDAQQGDELLIVEVTRLLDTQDTQDRALVEDGDYDIPISRVIGAWGDQATHAYHAQRVVRGSVRWHAPPTLVEEEVHVQRELDTHAEGSFVVQAKNKAIELRDTEYHYVCLSYEEMLEQSFPDQQVSIIASEPIVEQLKHVVCVVFLHQHLRPHSPYSLASFYCPWLRFHRLWSSKR